MPQAGAPTFRMTLARSAGNLKLTIAILLDFASNVASSSSFHPAWAVYGIIWQYATKLSETYAQAQCVPATLARRRKRRRFNERELLDRLHHYEELLRQNNIAFDPIHSGAITEKARLDAESDHEMERQVPEPGRAGSVPSTTLGSEKSYGAKNFWHAMSRGFRDPENDSDSSHDYVRETEVKRAWDETIQKNDNLLFGSRDPTVD
ncbi:hypothetical protein F66182_14452, partial [Fusarium sp. NRRL 66182]